MEEIKQYLRCAIVDIARKCNTKVDNVINVIRKEYGKN